MKPFRRMTHLVLALLCAMLLVGCTGSEKGAATSRFPNAYDSDDTWLVMWYVCGSDLESGYGAATDDIIELTQTSLPSNVRVLILAGGTTEWQNDAFDDALNLYLYDSDGLQQLTSLDDADMGSVKTLRDFIRYGEENFEADHRVFVFWDHGGGSAVGVCADERTENMLRLNDLRAAFEAVYEASPAAPPFELIGFDACLMASYETAASLEGFTRYMVASEEVEPHTGWNYSGWVGALAANPAMGGAGLGQVICDTYLDGCEEEDVAEQATLSVIDLAHMPTLRSAYEAFGREALTEASKKPRAFFSELGRDAEAAENYGGNTRDQGYANMVDLGGLAEEAKDNLPNTAAALAQAVDDAVIYKVHGNYRRRGSGISAYYSYDGDDDGFALYAEQDAAPLAQKCLLYYLIYGEMPEVAESVLNGAGTTGGIGVIPSVRRDVFDVAQLEDLPVDIDKDGNAFVKLDESATDLLSAIHCNLIYMSVEDDIMLFLGSDSNIDANWETGVFKDNFDGTWPMLDGHPVYIEITAEEDDYNLYSIPIKLNGELCNLQVSYTYADGAYHILGARRGLEANGMSSRRLIRLKAGDEITTIHYAMTISDDHDDDFKPVEVDTFRIGRNPQVKDEEVGDGSYGYAFEFLTPNGESALSNLVMFEVADDGIVTSLME